MTHSTTIDLGACDREPIHVPGAIQPHGLLLVVDETTDHILQAAGDATAVLDFRGPVQGNTLQAVLGVSLADLTDRGETVLLHKPTCLGKVVAFGDRELIITAHLADGAVVVEANPSAPHASTAKTLASIRSSTERIGGATTLIEACNLAAQEVRRITGYDRVMVYQFLADGSGSVIAEAKDDHLAPFLNHRYPASDIPQQARDLYRNNPIRIIPDIGYTPAPLVPALRPTTNRPLDMGHSILRSVSPVHIQYLKNMGVGASVSVSLLSDGELWGLIACHNMTARFVSYEMQEICMHVGQILSQQITARKESDSYRMARELGVARDKVMRLLIGADDPGALLFTLCPELQAIVPSHGVAVSRKGTVVMGGHVPTESQVIELTAWLERRLLGIDLFSTDQLSEEYPAAKTFASEACGLLATMLPGDDPTILMWFRAEQVEEINWAGNPHKPAEPGTGFGSLSPRKSFATWRETVRGRSRPWEAVEIESVQGFTPRAAFVVQQKKIRHLNDLLSHANEQLSSLVSTDGLTGISNRRMFDESLQKEWMRATRSQTTLAMIILDLDFFKQYNDHYGHLMGDECLRQVAQTMKGARRAADLVARIGGEEFSLILPATDIQGAMAVAETVRSRIEGLQLPHATSPMGVVTASFGVAVATPSRTESPNDLIHAADTALYKAKERGRNRVVTSSDG